MKSAILSAILLASTIPVIAADYYLVTPVKGKTASVSAIEVALAPAVLPDAKLDSAYAYNLTQHLQVTGDPGFTGFGVQWSLKSGSLPNGISLNGSTGVLAGTPTVSGGGPITVRASYKTKNAEQGYMLNAVASGSIVLQAAGYRTWADGSAAQSCNEYLTSTGLKAYSGATGDGAYRIQPSGQSAMNVYCDMTTDGGGWTLVVASSSNTNRITSGAAVGLAGEAGPRLTDVSSRVSDLFWAAIPGSYTRFDFAQAGVSKGSYYVRYGIGKPWTTVAYYRNDGSNTVPQCSTNKVNWGGGRYFHVADCYTTATTTGATAISVAWRSDTNTNGNFSHAANTTGTAWVR